MRLTLLRLLLPALLALSSVSALGQAAPDATPPPAVQLGEQSLFEIRTAFGPLSAAERARLSTEHLQGFADGKDPVSTLQLQRSELGYQLMAGSQALMVYTAADAQAAQTDLDTLARQRLATITQAVESYRSSRGTRSLLIGLALAFGSTLGLVLAIVLIRRGMALLQSRVLARIEHQAQGLHVRGVNLLTRQQITRLWTGLLRGVRLLLILLCLYLFIPLILSFFPMTRAFGRRLFQLFITPLESLLGSLLSYVPNLFYILIIGAMAYYMLKALHYGFRLIESGNLRLDFFYPEWATPTYQIVRVLVIAMAVISAFPYVPGSNSAAFQGVGLVLGLIVSFASSSAIANVIAGIILVYTRAFRIGDRIAISNEQGVVLEKTLLVTRLRTPKNVVVTIPNSLVLGNPIRNYSGEGLQNQAPLILSSTVTVGYDVPWKQVHALLLEAARRTEGLEAEPPPFVLQTALNDFTTSYEINASTHLPLEAPRLSSDLHRHIQDCFAEAGVEMTSPHYHAVRDGNASTIPAAPTSPGG